ncbi:Fur family transcriptional regulator [Demequina capsici]|uniref:Fur family transcriptional regulator n=1 Tax=Demequina capsici TaxID=3075620 RepID=A0AA96FEY6_9MICO|nr:MULTISPECIES: Fur family transcriptional regulator [unclassified Demequina]WNM25499.1 Fur family transcriptional regulator [Demequina sp. OYTSA14]WNM28390.1 Fur family transcriptional regulator [Demequina sp. PMTSA13]
MSDSTAPRPRMTRQRTAVLEALGHGDFRSAQSWHDLLRHDGSNIGLATVYRTLQSLAEAGDVDTVVTDAGETLYRRCETPEVHHHHLRCRVCGAAEDIDIPDLEEFAARIGAEHGFSDIAHMLELTGVCSSCQRAGR